MHILIPPLPSMQNTNFDFLNQLVIYVWSIRIQQTKTTHMFIVWLLLKFFDAYIYEKILEIHSMPLSHTIKYILPLLYVTNEDMFRLRLRQILFNINGYKYHIRFTCIWSKIQITVYSWYIIKHRHVRRPPLRSDLTAGMEATRRGKACTAMFILKTTSC